MEGNRLGRFLEAQNLYYLKAVAEIKKGKKETHWMWFIFPQLKELGKTETAKLYGIENIEEAQEYINHPVLGRRLIEITQELLSLENSSANEIFGKPDDRKLRSCMTLFSQVQNSSGVFNAVLAKYYNNKPDELTLKLLSSLKLKRQ